MLNNYPEAWQKRYVEQQYVKIDPTVQHCMVSLQPLVWSSQFAKTQEEKISGRRRALMALMSVGPSQAVTLLEPEGC